MAKDNTTREIVVSVGILEDVLQRAELINSNETIVKVEAEKNKRIVLTVADVFGGTYLNK